MTTTSQDVIVVRTHHDGHDDWFWPGLDLCSTTGWICHSLLLNSITIKPSESWPPNSFFSFQPTLKLPLQKCHTAEWNSKEQIITFSLDKDRMTKMTQRMKQWCKTHRTTIPGVLLLIFFYASFPETIGHLFINVWLILIHWYSIILT